MRAKAAGINQTKQDQHPVRARYARPSMRAVRKILTAVAIAIGAIAFEQTLAAAASEPLAEVRATIDEASAAFANPKLAPAERQQQLRAIAARNFDFAYMTRSAMGTHWKSLTPAQRKELVPLFTDHVMNTYLGRLRQSTVEAASHGLKDKVDFDGTDRATVYSEVHLPSLADPLAVNYSLRKSVDGWKLYDIIVDNVSTMASYRDEFNKTMNGGGYAKLVSDLRGEPASATP